MTTAQCFEIKSCSLFRWDQHYHNNRNLPATSVFTSTFLDPSTTLARRLCLESMASMIISPQSGFAHASPL